MDKNGHLIDLSSNRTQLNRAVNDYSIVIQEFFIKRATDFLNTIGKDALGIEYYWGRFEFTKGRGQIHIHLLAILNLDMMNNLQRQLDERDLTPEKEAEMISQWAESQFGMTATMNSSARSPTTTTSAK